MKRRLHLFGFYLRAVLYSLPLFSFGVAWYLRFDVARDVRPGAHSDAAYLRLLVFILAVWIAALEHYGLCNPERLFLPGMSARKLFGACLTTYLTTAALLFFYRETTFSRLFLPISAILLLGLATVTRIAFERLAAAKFRGSCPVRVLVVGADAFARRAARQLTRAAHWCRIAGYVRLPGQKVATVDGPFFELEDLDGLYSSSKIDEVAIAVASSRLGELHGIIAAIEKFGVPTRVILDVGSDLFTRDRLFRLGRLNILDVGTGPADAVDYIVLKRLFDIAFSVLVLFVVAPLMLLIAIAIRLTSPGPIIFRQERIGLNGRSFQMYKFRTMEMSNSREADTHWTRLNDPRRTRLGMWLRRSSLDELPQFLNVLKGDMSVVGPRPERPFFVRKFVNEVYRYQTRHQLKVGITGWAQVNGLRGDTSIDKRVEYDLYYMRNWGFGFDLRIILRTLWNGLFSSNAY